MIRAKIVLPALLTAGLLLTPNMAAADKISDAIKTAAEAYKDGKLGKAAQELQYAVTKIGERLSKAYRATFPPTPDGWRARKIRSSSGGGIVRMNGQILNRRYNQKDGRGRMTAQLIVDSPAMQAYATLFANPAYARQAGFDREKIDGVPETAMVKFNEDRKRGEAVLLMAGRILIRISASGIENASAIVKLLKSWKIAEVRKIAGLK